MYLGFIVVSDKSNIAKDVSIGAYAIISDGVDLGEGSVVGPMCYIGTDTKIGAKAYLREGVKIGSDVFIGDRFIAQPGAVVGSDGFSFVTAELSDVEIARESLGKAQISKNEGNLSILRCAVTKFIHILKCSQSMFVNHSRSVCISVAFCTLTKINCT